MLKRVLESDDESAQKVPVKLDSLHYGLVGRHLEVTRTLQKVREDSIGLITRKMSKIGAASVRRVRPVMGRRSLTPN